MINVTKTFLPPQKEYQAILKKAWDTGWITNIGVLVQELKAKFKDYLTEKVKNSLFNIMSSMVFELFRRGAKFDHKNEIFEIYRKEKSLIKTFIFFCSLYIIKYTKRGYKILLLSR